MAKIEVRDRVRVMAKPENWPPCTEFTLLGAEGTASLWVDWPEAMDAYTQFVYVKIDKAIGPGMGYEGAHMLFHEHTLEKL